MSNKTDPVEGNQPDPGEIPCQRVQRPLSSRKHLRCPYCFGDENAVKAGKHADFCEFNPDRDPVNFGFPQTHGRHLDA